MSDITDEAQPLELLRSRGLVDAVTDERLGKLLAGERVTFYVGFDPTASSLHVGSLIGIMTMAWLQRLGHRPIVVAGGATGRIGDPSGRDTERELLTEKAIAANLAAQRSQLASLLDLSDPQVGLMVDNHDWLGRLDLIGFLREVGKHFSVNQMVSREAVRRRLETREQGMSFTEFSYQLLQAYDFAYLYRTYGCRLQLGGSDQWGNIVSGVELTRRLHDADVYGLTWPLLTDAEGQKFGKTAGRPVWLDAERTSPYAFYQWWLNTHDEDAIRYLRLFTFLEEDEIDELGAAHSRDPAARSAQRRLAAETTRLVHGDEALAEARRATEVLFGDAPYHRLDDELLADAFAAAPSADLARARLEEGIGLLTLMTEVGAAGSNSQARRLVDQGAVRLNNVLVTDPGRTVEPDDLAGRTTLVLQVGKKRHYLARFA